MLGCKCRIAVFQGDMYHFAESGDGLLLSFSKWEFADQFDQCRDFSFAHDGNNQAKSEPGIRSEMLRVTVSGEASGLSGAAWVPIASSR